MFEDDVAPIDVPEVSKTFKKARVIRPFFSSTTCMPKNTNSGNPAGLRTRKAWQRRYRTADGCKEITSSHRLRLDHISPGDQSTPPTATMALPVPVLIVPADIPLPCAFNASSRRSPLCRSHSPTGGQPTPLPLPVSKLTIASNSRPRREHRVGGVIFRVPTGPCQRGSQRVCGTTACDRSETYALPTSTSGIAALQPIVASS